MAGKVITYPTMVPQQIIFKGKAVATIEPRDKSFCIKVWVDDYLRYGIEVEEIVDGRDQGTEGKQD